MSTVADASVPLTSSAARSTVIARWTAAAIAIFYGFAKLTGSQFTILDSQLDRPLGSISGFWLTWYYFGYSQVYGNLIALVQIGGGWLLLFPRTARLGAAVLLPAAVNIVLVDIFYGIDLGGLLMAVLLTLLLLVVLAPSIRPLLALLVAPGPGTSPWGIVPRLLLPLLALGFTYWAANFNNRFPTPIDGVWQPVDSLPAPGMFDRVFFERNRAHMAVFRFPGGRYVTHDFRLDSIGQLQISDTWLSPGDPSWKGMTSADGNVIQMWTASGVDTIELRRVSR